MVDHDLLAAKPERIEAVDRVVVRAHGLPEDRLYFEPKREASEVVRVGDAVAVRLLDRAIFDGHAAGRSL